jgi:hypothetical protein
MDALERVIRPIVEGQIRGFLKEHPAIVEAVDWYKPRKDKALTFTNSLAKRIVLDLTCDLTRERIEAAMFEIWESGVAISTAPDGVHVGRSSDVEPVSSVQCGECGEGDQIGMATDLVAMAIRANVMDGTFQPGWMEIERAA